MENHKRTNISIMNNRSVVKYLICLFGLYLLLPMNSSAQETKPNYETSLQQTLETLVAGRFEDSLANIQQMLEVYPNSKLAYKILGDVLSARASKEPLKTIAKNQSTLLGYTDEIKQRWSRIKQQSPVFSGLIPSNLIQASPDQQYILIVDSKAARVYVYEHKSDEYSLVADHYITVGKQGMAKIKEGDQKTPIGVYFVTSYLPGNTLPDRYGPGAFPINYPNEFDQRLNRTGYGIWLHGTESDNYSRVPYASDGCVSLSNEDFIDLSYYVKTDGSTPVIISDQIKWIEPQEMINKKHQYLTLLESWATDLKSLDVEKYLSHYSNQNFQVDGINYKSWAKQKRIIASSKEYINLKISNISIYAYPSKKNMVVISFKQQYESNNYNDISQKKQYWQKNDKGSWQIINETSSS